MSYTLFGDIGSGAAIVELALAEIGVPYELVEVDLGAAQQREESYAALNPQRKVPALVDAEGHTLTESVAILLTLDERHPDATLLPSGGSDERAQALRWLLFVATELYPVVEINDYPARFAHGTDEVHAAVRERAREIWRQRWLIVESNIGGDPFLLRSGLCMTDLYISVVSRWAQQDDWRPSNLPKVERLTAAVASRAALATVWKKHFP